MGSWILGTTDSFVTKFPDNLHIIGSLHLALVSSSSFGHANCYRFGYRSKAGLLKLQVAQHSQRNDEDCHCIFELACSLFFHHSSYHITCPHTGARHQKPEPLTHCRDMFTPDLSCLDTKAFYRLKYETRSTILFSRLMLESATSQVVAAALLIRAEIKLEDEVQARGELASRQQGKPRST